MNGSMTMVDKERRRALRALGATGLIGLAGCTGNGDGGDGSDGGSDGSNDGSDGGGSDGGGGDGGSTPTETSGSNGGSQDAVSWWNLAVQGTAKEAAAELASMFEEETDIPVEQTKYENTPYKSAITNALGTSESPDVFYIWPGPNRLGRYVGNENVLDLDDLLTEDQRSAQIPDAIRGTQYEEGEILSWRSEEGGMFAIPYDVAGITLWYNKTVLEDAGVDIDRIQHATDVTWDEFLDICSTLQDAGYTPIQCGNRNRWAIGHWISAFMIKAVGVDTYYDAAFGLNDVSFTDERFVTAMERLKQLHDDNYLNRDINSLNNNEAASLFFNGQAGFWHQGTWVTEQISSQAPDSFGGVPDEMDYMWWPAFPDLYDNSANERMSVVPNSTVAISAQAAERGEEHLQDAMDFAQFFGSYEAQKRYFEITGSPVTRTDVYEEMDLDATQETLTSTLNQMETADAIGMVFDVAFLPEATETLLSGGQELFTDGDAATVLENLQETNEEALSDL